MASGLDTLTTAAQEARARQAAYQANRVAFAKFPEGQPRRVRFLEQGEDVAWAYVHELPKTAGQKVASVTPCLTQEGAQAQACPGCEMGFPRKIKGWISLIMRDAPVYQKGPDGKDYLDPLSGQKVMVGQADQVQLWNSGPNVFTTLGQKDRTFKGLMSRDFVVIRSGDGYGTTYSIEPADADGGPQPMSKADLELAGDKPNARKFAMPETYEDAKQLLMGVPRSALKASQEAVAQAAAPESNYFEEAMRKAREESA